MRQILFVLGFGLAAFCSVADDTPDAPAVSAPNATVVPAAAPVLVPEPAWSPRPPRPRAIGTASSSSPAATAVDAGQPAQFTSEGTWDLAGYNNDEVIYTIFITSHDPRIIRCITELQGFYYEKGEKISVADRQSITVFPEQRVKAGNWQGMDQKSGATYAVKCHSA